MAKKRKTDDVELNADKIVQQRVQRTILRMANKLCGKGTKFLPTFYELKKFMDDYALLISHNPPEDLDADGWEDVYKRVQFHLNKR